MDELFTISQYYNLIGRYTKDKNMYCKKANSDPRHIYQNFISNISTGNTLKIQNVYWILCQYSSAWLEHQICNLRVVGSDPIIGFLIFIKITSKE